MLQFHQQITRQINSTSNHHIPTHQLDTFQQQVCQAQKIKYQDDFALLEDLQLDWEEERQLPTLRMDQEATYTLQPRVREHVRLQIEKYVKAGQNLLYLFCNLKNLSFENKSVQQLSSYDSISGQTIEEDKSEISNQYLDKNTIPPPFQKSRKPQFPNKQRMPQHFQKNQVSQSTEVPPKQVYKFLSDKDSRMDGNQESESDPRIQRQKRHHKLSEIQIQSLKQDLRMGLFTKSQLTKKYQISGSTLFRYVQRFNYSAGVMTIQRQQPFHVIYQKMKEAGYFRPYNTYKKRSQQVFDIEQYRKNNVEKTEKKQTSRRFLQSNLPTNIHYRYLFMKQFNKLDQDKIIFVDQVYFWKITSETLVNNKSNSVSSVGTFTHPKLGYMKEINILIAISNVKIVHWKIKPQKFTKQNVEHFLTEIHQKMKEYTFIMDNHSTHKNQNLRLNILQKGIQVEYLPPCSPQMNPIITFFKNFKMILSHRLKDSHTTMMLMQQTQKLMKQMENQGKHQGFFSRNVRFWKMAEKKQMLPVNQQ